MRMMVVIIILIILQTSAPTGALYSPAFDGSNAYTFLQQQCDLGPRPPGSENLEHCRTLIANTLEGYGWYVEFQNFTYMDTACANIVASWPASNATTLILGSHYDTRPHADQDPDPKNRTRPIFGANDGASSTAILLELARAIPVNARRGVELVFFDAEDSGYINGWDWIVGSTHYAQSLNESAVKQIKAMVLLDMVGDKKVVLKRELGSTRALQNTIWSIAAQLGQDDVFLDSYGSSVLDDHRPFLTRGIPSVDIIQHNPFPWYWHTMEDTPDKCSADSLEIVGGVVETFVVTQASNGTEYPLDTMGFDPFVVTALVAVGIIMVVVTIRKRGT